jgi:hypothetical protein
MLVEIKMGKNMIKFGKNEIKIVNDVQCCYNRIPRVKKILKNNNQECPGFSSKIPRVKTI